MAGWEERHTAKAGKDAAQASSGAPCAALRAHCQSAITLPHNRLGADSGNEGSIRVIALTWQVGRLHIIRLIAAAGASKQCGHCCSPGHRRVATELQIVIACGCSHLRRLCATAWGPPSAAPSQAAPIPPSNSTGLAQCHCLDAASFARGCKTEVNKGGCAHNQGQFGCPWHVNLKSKEPQLSATYYKPWR